MKRQLLLTFLFIGFVMSNISYASDLYDVILFWGQSSMVGSSGIFDEEELPDNHQNQGFWGIDSRLV